MTDGSGPVGANQGALEAAIQRLDQAVAQLDLRIGGLFDQDRAQLAAELDASRARERQLEEAGAAASQALGHAIAGVRAALGD